MTRSLLLRCATGALLLLVLTACGDTPVRAGAAATVGQTRITTDELASLVNRALADPRAQQQLGADRVAFQRQSLSRLINHDLLVVAARRQHVSVTPGQVDARLADFEQQSGGPQMLVQQAAANGIAQRDLRGFVQDLVLGDALGDALTRDLPVSEARLRTTFAQSAARNDQVHVAHILVATAAQAESIRRQVVASPALFAGLAERFSTDSASKVKGGDLGFAGHGTYVPAFDKAAFGTPVGQVVVVRTEFGFHVLKVLERRTTTFEQAIPQLRRAVLRTQREQRLAELLSGTAAELRVTVNPRFGRWSSASGSVEEIPVDGHSVSSPAPVNTADALIPDLGQPQQGQPQTDPQQQGQPQTDPQQQGQPQTDPQVPPSP